MHREEQKLHTTDSVVPGSSLAPVGRAKRATDAVISQKTADDALQLLETPPKEDYDPPGGSSETPPIEYDVPDESDAQNMLLVEAMKADKKFVEYMLNVNGVELGKYLREVTIGLKALIKRGKYDTDILRTHQKAFLGAWNAYHLHGRTDDRITNLANALMGYHDLVAYTVLDQALGEE